MCLESGVNLFCNDARASLRIVRWECQTSEQPLMDVNQFCKELVQSVALDPCSSTADTSSTLWEQAGRRHTAETLPSETPAASSCEIRCTHLIDNKPYRGHNGGAGEIGCNLKLPEPDHRAGCGSHAARSKSGRHSRAERSGSLADSRSDPPPDPAGPESERRPPPS